ncbi:CvpA family protein [Agrilutibacter solisilvae]|uniref:CvpA family protein n=1 Tax=Agrilutibacter solisilvae TaxID=2763317 RepID=A0A974XXU2_9GAMM|nr:CvpA family protein [Lysobacter solisilvae]QSX76940.1 CvpA family protein [Lysobacter solisilvae]
MTALDWVLLLIIVVSTVMGALRGLIGVVASLAAWLLAGLAAYQFGAGIGAMLTRESAPGWGERVSGYVLAFLLVWLLVTLAGWMLRKLADSAGLTPLDRALGLGLGAARGLLLACALLLALGLSAVPREPVWRESAGVAALGPMTAWMRAGVPDWMAQRMDLDGQGGSLQDQLQDQARAVQAALPPGVDIADLAALPQDADVAAAVAQRDQTGAAGPAVEPADKHSSQGATGTTSDASLVP